ncbi:MAG: ligand-binding sensor domain-containing protein [Verrucomicrobiota bacterium]
MTVETNPELAANEIQFLTPMEDELWIGTLSDLTRYRDGGFAAATEMTEEKRRNPDTDEWEIQQTPAKADRQICDIIRKTDGTYLVGTASGLFNMRKLMLGEVALKDNTVAPILAFDEETLWALAENGDDGTVYENSTGEWKTVDKFADKAVTNLIRTRDGTFWILVDGNGAYEVNPSKGIEHAEHHLAGLNIRSLLLDSRGRVWCGLWGRGVAMRQKDGTWTEHLEYEKSAVLNLSEAGDGSIWAGTSSSGVYRYDGEEWSNHLPDDGAVSLLYTDSNGRLWLSTQRRGGLRYWDDGQWQTSLDNRLPMTCMIEHEGALWAGGVLDGIHIKPLD